MANAFMFRNTIAVVSLTGISADMPIRVAWSEPRYVCSSPSLLVISHLLTMKRGPNWIHGTDDNPVWQIAKEAASLCVVPDTMHVFEPSGTIMPEELAESGLETVWEIIEQAFKYSNEDCLNIKAGLNLEDFFREKLAEGELTEEEKARILLLAEMWGSFIGDSWTRQSLRWFWLEECLEGGAYSLGEKSRDNADML